MTSEGPDDLMMPRSAARHSTIAGAAASDSKPLGGARVLLFVLQALVMVVALALFCLFAGVAALVLLHLCFAGRAFRRRLHTAPGGPSLSSADLGDLPCFDYPRGGGRAPADCAVCLEEFRDGDRCRALPGCGHAFHATCVDRWLAMSTACPICRGEVLQCSVGSRRDRWL